MAAWSRAYRRAVLVHRGWRYSTRVDRDEIRWMRSVLRRGDLAVDVGAYKGGYTYWMRRAVGPGGRVVAFEPQPRLASYLRQCVADFGWRNVEVVEAGLSSIRGELDMYVPVAPSPSPAASLVGASHQPGASRYPVRVDTLDRYLDEHAPGVRVRIIKCDVEGHELEVFRGGLRTLTTHRPCLLFECEQRHLARGTVEDVFSYLGELGYGGWFFWKGSRRPLEDFDVAAHQVDGRRPYANNFAFVHRDG